MAALVRRGGPFVAVLALAVAQFLSCADASSKSGSNGVSVSDGTADASGSDWPSPVGLCLGLAAVAVVQLAVTLPYYYALRTGMISRPFIQIKRNSSGDEGGKSFFQGVIKHLSNPEGFVLLGGYLAGTWMFNLMPPSYYVLWESRPSLVDVALQLLINDFYQTLAHLAEHQIKCIYKNAHKPHHKHTSPMLFDAFDGDFLDTVFMILIPLYSTCLTMAYLLGRDVSVWSYMIFGSLYANYLCLIHSEYEHPWDSLFMKLGIGTPADHHVHHKLFNRNFGHLFMYWDKMFGTYTDPRSVTKHFVKTFE